MNEDAEVYQIIVYIYIDWYYELALVQGLSVTSLQRDRFQN